MKVNVVFYFANFQQFNKFKKFNKFYLIFLFFGCRIVSLFRHKTEGYRIYAIPEAGRFWPVIKNMSQMPAAFAAMHFCPYHSITFIQFLFSSIQFSGQSLHHFFGDVLSPETNLAFIQRLGFISYNIQFYFISS